jgi:hypothetical protein
MMKPGFIPNMPFEEYFKVEALSNSGLRRLKKSAAHFRVPWQPKDQKVLDIGSAFHTATLEPDRYDSRYAVTDLKLSTKDGKQFQQESVRSGKTIIKQAEHKNIQAMAKAVREHPDAGPLVQGGVSELSCFWIDPDYDFPCKCRLDKITDNMVIIDLKKTQDAEEGSSGFGAFYKSFFSLYYHYQAYWYLTGVSIASSVPHDTFAFIAVEEQPPHGVNVFVPDKEVLVLAMEEIEPLKILYAECLNRNEWPCYPPGPNTIGLPAWAKKQMSPTFDY